MPRTAVHVTTLTPNVGTADPAGTTLDATNNHSIAPGGPTEEFIIRITNTFAGTKVATIKAGTNPPADAAGQGDITVSLTDGSTTPQVAFVGPLTSARFINSDGTVHVDLAASMTGKIEAFRIPRTA
jgi:hypothetical protein